MGRLLWRLFLLLCAVGAGVILLAALVLFTPVGFRAALGIIHTYLPVNIFVEEYRHTPGEIVLKRVSIVSPEGPFADVPFMKIRYNLLPLVRGRIELSLVELDGPVVQITRHDDGTSTIDWLYNDTADHEGTSFSIPWPLEAEEVSIKDAGVHYYEEQGGRGADLVSLELHGNLSSVPFQSEIVVEHGLLTLGNGSYQGHLEGYLHAHEGELWLDSLSVTYPDSMVHAKGYYSLDTEIYRADLDVESLPLGEVLDTLKVASLPVLWTSGTLHLEGQGLFSGNLRGAIDAYGYGQRVRATLDASLAETKIILNAMRLTNAEGSITGNAQWDYTKDQLDGAFRLEASSLSKTLEAVGLHDTYVERLLAQAHVVGSFARPQFTLNAKAGKASFSSILVQGIQLQGNVADKDGIVATMTMEKMPLGGTWNTKGTIEARVTKDEVQARLSGPPGLGLQIVMNKDTHLAVAHILLRSVDVSPLLTAFLGESCIASVTAEGKVQGTLPSSADGITSADWKGIGGSVDLKRIYLQCKNLTITNDRPCVLAAKDGLLTLNASLRANRGSIALNGSVPLGNHKGKVEIITSASLDLMSFNRILTRFLPEVRELQGTLRCEGTLSGPMKALTANGVFSLNNGMIVLGKATRDPASSGEDIFRGRINLEASINGPITTPSGAMTVSIDAGTLYGIPITSVKAQASSDGKTVTMDHADLLTEGGQVTVKGSVDLRKRTLSGLVSSTQLNLERIVTHPDMHVQGTLYLNGSLDGTLSEPHLQVKIPAADLQWNETALGSIETAIDLNKDVVSIETILQTGHIHGTINLKNGYHLSLKAVLQKTLLHPFFSLAGLPPEVQGEVSLQAGLEATLPDLELLSGKILCEHLLITKDELRLVNDSPLMASIKDGTVLLNRADLRIHEFPLSVQGILWKDLDLSIIGTLPLEVANDIVPWVRVDSGRADLDARIKGNPASPQIYGQMVLAATNVLFPNYYPHPIDRLSGSLRFNANRLELVSLAGEVADATVSASGTVHWNPLSFDGCKIEASLLPYRIPDTLNAVLSGSLTLNGNASASYLEGKVRIVHARYYKDLEIAGEVLRARRPEIAATRSYPDFLKHMNLSILIESGPDLFIRNNLGRLLLSVNVNVEGMYANPVPEGRVNVLEGSIYYSEKEFEITEGYLEYPGESGKKPTLHLSSRVEVQGKTREYVIFLDLDGLLDRITISLRSIPDLEREDIIFVLLTGKTEDEYFSTTSGPTGERAKQLAFTGLSSMFSDDIKAWTGLDTFLMEGTEGSDLGVKATLAKRFNERFEVRGIIGIGSGREVSEAQVEYRLTDAVYLVSTQRSDGSFGLDLRVRYQH